MTSLSITRSSTRIKLNCFGTPSSLSRSNRSLLHSFRTPVHHRHLGSTAFPPPPKKRALVDIALIAAGFFSIGATILWLQNQKQDRVDDPLAQALQSREQFEIPIASHTGSPGAKKILTMLSTEEVDQLLRKYETTFSVNRLGNPVYRYDTNHVASNAPIEDDSLCAVMTRDQSLLSPNSTSKPLAKDMLFFGVFDGHSGWQTSKLLAEQLVPSVNRELHSVFRSEPEYVAPYLARELTKAHATQNKKTSGQSTIQQVEIPRGVMERIWDILRWNKQLNRTIIADLDQDDEIVKLAMQNAFVKLDNQIVGRPIQMLAAYEAQRKSGEKGIPKEWGSDVTPQQTASLQALLPALSGSCALLAYIDTFRSKVHVACTGDSRAVMGVWDPKADQGKGKWKAHLLSEDQEGMNPKEVERMRSEHPLEERQNVIRRGRVLGGLQPTRAFGDARYKWPVGIQGRLYEAFHPSGKARREPPDYLTPPYVTAKPEVISTSIPTPSETNKSAFVVLATDGLWDRLETSEVVGLVGRWIEMGGQDPSVLPKQHVLSKGQIAGPDKVQVIHPPGSSAPTAHDPQSSSEQSFIFQDTNVATHLIRNALGGASRDKVGALLSIPAPHSRRYRDDITVTVVFIDPEKGNQDSSRKDLSNGVHEEGVVKTKPQLIGVPKL